MNLLWYLSFLDMYGSRVSLYIDGETKVRSKFGALISLTIVILCLYSLIDKIIDWNNFQNLQTISASHTYNINNLLRVNKNHSFTLDSDNYYIYFILSSKINGTTVRNKNLSRYLNYSVVYQFIWGNDLIEKNIELESCYDHKTNDFLLLSNSDLSDYNQRSKTRMCIKGGQNISIGLFPNPSFSIVHIPGFSYTVRKCVNSTSNNNSCASDEEIEKVIRTSQVQVSLPKSIYDFSDIKFPRQRAYDYKVYGLDVQFSKAFYANLLPIYLMTDYGWIYDDYKVDSTDFNVENLDFETQNIDASQKIFEFTFQFGFNDQIYYRKNLKFLDIIGSFGGIINILFLIGKLICYSYNLLALKHSLINFCFSNLDKQVKNLPISNEKRF